MMMIAMLAIFAISASAGNNASKKQVEIANAYAEYAQEKFELTDEQKATVVSLKTEEFSNLNTAIKPLKEAGSSKEVIQAKTKEIKKITYPQLAEAMGCPKKELNAFNKEFNAMMKAKKNKK